jgi:hypothetical protein
MSADEYNYRVFDGAAEEFREFAVHAPKTTMRAPSFPLEDLVTGRIVEMNELWRSEVALIEFGSFT